VKLLIHRRVFLYDLVQVCRKTPAEGVDIELFPSKISISAKRSQLQLLTGRDVIRALSEHVQNDVICSSPT